MPSENVVKATNVTNRSGFVDNSKRVPNKAVKKCQRCVYPIELLGEISRRYTQKRMRL